MNIFKFLKYYKEFKKVSNQLINLVNLSNSKKEHHKRLLKNNKGTLIPYHKKKLEFYDAQAKAYENSIKLITHFLNTGNITED